MAKRGRTIPYVGEWWRRLARNVISNDPRDLRTLGKDLAKHVRGKSKFDHALLSKFASGAVDSRTGERIDPTFELVEALCAEFSRLPRPLFFARSYEEAVHIQSVTERYDHAVTDEHLESSLVPLPTREERRRRGRSSSAPATSSNSHAPKRRAKLG